MEPEETAGGQRVDKDIQERGWAAEGLDPVLDLNV